MNKKFAVKKHLLKGKLVQDNMLLRPLQEQCSVRSVCGRGNRERPLTTKEEGCSFPFCGKLMGFPFKGQYHLPAKQKAAWGWTKCIKTRPCMFTLAFEAVWLQSDEEKEK